MAELELVLRETLEALYDHRYFAKKMGYGTAEYMDPWIQEIEKALGPEVVALVKRLSSSMARP